jgi:hypothetical protein
MSEPATDAAWTAFFAARDAARRKADAARCAALRGNPTLAASVRAEWLPIRQFQQEMHRHGQDRDQRTRTDACGIVN